MKFNPEYAVTESAISLIHQISSLENEVGSFGSTVKIGRMKISNSELHPQPSLWLRETLILRIVSVTEAYLDTISMARLNGILSQDNLTIKQLVEDFERESGKTWSQRHDYFRRYHSVVLRSVVGWPELDAGIQLRNSIAHGLGKLTAQQRSNTTLLQLISKVGATIGAGRIHTSNNTVGLLSKGAMEFVLAVDSLLSK